MAAAGSINRVFAQETDSSYFERVALNESNAVLFSMYIIEIVTP